MSIPTQMSLSGFIATVPELHHTKGDSFIASGYVHEYEVERNGTSVVREEFVARRIGHDMVRTTYDVRRRDLRPPEPSPTRAPSQAPAVGM